MSVDIYLKLNNYIEIDENYNIYNIDKAEKYESNTKAIFVKYLNKNSDIENILNYESIINVLSNIELTTYIVLVCNEKQYNEICNYIYNFESIRDYILGMDNDTEIINNMLNEKSDYYDIIDFMYYCKNIKSNIEPENKLWINEIKKRFESMEIYVILKDDLIHINS